MSNDPLYVTRPYLPPLKAILPYLEEIWRTGQVTNNGPQSLRLEKALAEYLGVRHLSLMSNGTMALMTAIKALNLSGEVITTPFSFVATAHALLWNGITPVFVDIDPDSLNLDPARVEAAITPRTTGILPVHVYGRPCNHPAIQDIADHHDLKVLYDAAHSVGVQSQGQNLFAAGDMSVLSFHATKVFHTFEGGAVICKDADMKQQIDRMRNFGFAGETSVISLGLNAKLNEIQAAFGHLHLEHLDQLIARRQAIDSRYRHGLDGITGIRCLNIPNVARYNYGYFPILVDEPFPIDREGLYRRLRRDNIHVRRYFYPLITDFPMYHNPVLSDHYPVALKVARSVLCLPLYPDMTDADCDRVVEAIRIAGLCHDLICH
jgi:dTDP-4-amino-4,6-dideoxygalactose transaminase